MNVDRAERPRIVCIDCHEQIEVYAPSHITTDVLNLPVEYVCDKCMDKRGEPRWLTEDGIVYIHEWTRLMPPTHLLTQCVGCGKPMWGLGFVLKEARELASAQDGSRALYLAGTRVELTECPNPQCAFAWGTGAHHEQINKRYPWMKPPWADPKNFSIHMGLLRFMREQIGFNAEWWWRRRMRKRSK